MAELSVLASRLRGQQLQRQFERMTDRALGEWVDQPVIVAPPDDDVRKRGIPMIAKGINGEIRGTRPDRVVR